MLILKETITQYLPHFHLMPLNGSGDLSISSTSYMYILSTAKSLMYLKTIVYFVLLNFNPCLLIINLWVFVDNSQKLFFSLSSDFIHLIFSHFFSFDCANQTYLLNVLHFSIYNLCM